MVINNDTIQAAAVQESKTPIVDAAELAHDKMIANRFIGRQGEQKDLPNPWDIARQLELALAASQEREEALKVEISMLYDSAKLQQERLETASKAMKKVKPIVGAAVAASTNETRPIRKSAYNQLCAAIDAALAERK